MNKTRSVAGWVLGLLAGASAVLAFACSSDDKNAAPGPTNDAAAQQDAAAGPQTAAPSAETQALWQKIRDYKTWPKFEENTEPKQSQGHENMWVVAFYNGPVGKAIADKTVPLPADSIIVKENRPQPNAEPMVLTVMSKQAAGWYWVKGTPDGRVMTSATGAALEGEVQMCIDCHMKGAPDNDGVFTHDFSPAK